MLKKHSVRTPLLWEKTWTRTVWWVCSQDMSEPCLLSAHMNTYFLYLCTGENLTGNTRSACNHNSFHELQFCTECQKPSRCIETWEKNDYTGLIRFKTFPLHMFTLTCLAIAFIQRDMYHAAEKRSNILLFQVKPFIPYYFRLFLSYFRLSPLLFIRLIPKILQ